VSLPCSSSTRCLLPLPLPSLSCSLRRTQHVFRSTRCECFKFSLMASFGAMRLSGPEIVFIYVCSRTSLVLCPLEVLPYSLFSMHLLNPFVILIMSLESLYLQFFVFVYHLDPNKMNLHLFTRTLSHLPSKMTIRTVLAFRL
jgi:hypothetical protein